MFLESFQRQANALARFTANNDSRQVHVDQMVAASNLLQNNIRDQQREAERLESELDSLKESIAKSSTKLANVRAFSWIFMLFALLYCTLTSLALCIKYDLFIHDDYVSNWA